MRRAADVRGTFPAAAAGVRRCARRRDRAFIDGLERSDDVGARIARALLQAARPEATAERMPGTERERENEEQ